MFRALDPLLGIFTGVLAFQLRQSNPKTAPPEDERLDYLVKWKYAQWKEKKQQRETADDTELWEALKTAAEQVRRVSRRRAFL